MTRVPGILNFGLDIPHSSAWYRLSCSSTLISAEAAQKWFTFPGNFPLCCRAEVGKGEFIFLCSYKHLRLANLKQRFLFFFFFFFSLLGKKKKKAGSPLKILVCFLSDELNGLSGCGAWVACVCVWLTQVFRAAFLGLTSKARCKAAFPFCQEGCAPCWKPDFELCVVKHLLLNAVYPSHLHLSSLAHLYLISENI